MINATGRSPCRASSSPVSEARAGVPVAPKKKPCRCEAYAFPHRMYGGRCEAFDPERGDEESADRWLMGLMERGHRNIDELLDDNRLRYKP